jgi:hypothetical protein
MAVPFGQYLSECRKHLLSACRILPRPLHPLDPQFLLSDPHLPLGNVLLGLGKVSVLFREVEVIGHSG